MPMASASELSTESRLVWTAGVVGGKTSTGGDACGDQRGGVGRRLRGAVGGGIGGDEIAAGRERGNAARRPA